VLLGLSPGLEVHFGNGDGTFDPPALQLPGVSFGGLATGDLNGDGRTDFATFRPPDSILVSLAGPGGVYGAPAPYVLAIASFGRLEIGEATGDALLDVVYVPEGVLDISVLPGVGAGALGAPVTSSRLTGARANDFALGLLDGDALPDLVIATNFRLERLIGAGGGTLTAQPLLESARSPLAVQVADLDLDGDRDVVVANVITSAAHVYEGDGSGALAAGRGFGSGGRAAVGVGVADMDLDGLPDLLLANGASGDVSVLLAPGTVGVPPPGPPAAGALSFAAWPIPSAGALWVRFVLPEPAEVRVDIHDLQGRRVATRPLGLLPAGEQRQRFEEAATLPPGLYWLRLSQGNRSFARRVVIAR
jgi:hypothetical protein